MNGKQAKKIRKLVAQLGAEDRQDEMTKVMKSVFTNLTHSQKKTSALFSRD